MPLTRRSLMLATAPALVGAACAVQTTPKTQELRRVTHTVQATPTRDGAGVKLARILGGRSLPMLDPFLMLDEFHSDQPEDWQRGFPDHPHRGFETVTLMLDGEVTHQDSVGNAGTIGAGDVQWMTAGRGIIHSEMPRAARPGGDLWGFQLWVNLPARQKMTAPRYQEIRASAFPTVDIDDSRARVLAGAVGPRRGPIEDIAVDPVVLDVTLPARGRFRHDVFSTHTAALYVVRGDAAVGERALGAGTFAVLGPGTTVDMTSSQGGQVLLLAARPLGEPVARRGPFVMNTDAELRQAFDDYRSGRLVGG